MSMDHQWFTRRFITRQYGGSAKFDVPDLERWEERGSLFTYFMKIVKLNAPGIHSIQCGRPGIEEKFKQKKSVN